MGVQAGVAVAQWWVNGGPANLKQKLTSALVDLCIIEAQLRSFYQEHGKELAEAIVNNNVLEIERLRSKLPEKLRGVVDATQSAVNYTINVVGDSITPDNVGYIAGQIAYEFLEDAVITAAIAAITVPTAGAGATAAAPAVAFKAAKISRMLAKIADKTKIGKEVIEQIIKHADDLIWWFNKSFKMCFVAGTPVHTSAGLKPIEEIAAGDLVLSRPENDPKALARYQRVLQTFVTHPVRLYSVTYRTAAGSETVTCTGEHPFYVENAKTFVNARQLRPGCRLKLISGDAAEVISVTSEDALPGERFTTYNFEVEDDHTYHVGALGVWVHNTGAVCDEVITQFLKKGGGFDLPGKDLRDTLEQKLLEHLVEELKDLEKVSDAELTKHFDDIIKQANQQRRASHLDELDPASAADDLGKKLRQMQEAAAAEEAKRVPNPGGRLGNAATRAKTQEVIEDLADRGFTEIDVEVQFKPGPNSMKERYVDVIGKNPATGEVEIIQIGRTIKSDPRVPIIRERQALDDIIMSPDIKKYKNATIRFVDVNAPGVVQP
jgi:hypothetical protein